MKMFAQNSGAAAKILLHRVFIPTQQKQSKSGFAIIAVLFIIAVISTFMAMLVYGSSQRIHVSKRLINKIKAKAFAEAGCEFGYAVLCTNWDARLDPGAFSSVKKETLPSGVQIITITSSSGETYTLSVEAIGLDAALVSSTGSCSQATAEAVVGIRDFGGSTVAGDPFDTTAFNYAIVCGGTFDFRGCGTISSPSGESLFHSNGAMDLKGNTHSEINLSSSIEVALGNLTVGGDVTAPSIDKHKKAKINGTESVQAVPPVPIPDIDFTPYYNYALSHGEVHTGFSTSSSYTPSGGIIWVNGDVQLSSHAVISGSIIATGNIHVSGQVDIVPSTSAFCVASRDGNITVTSSGTLNGLIYAKTGNLSHTANGQINGQIIINGSINKGGNSDIMTSYSPEIPSPPGGMPATKLIGIAAWQK